MLDDPTLAHLHEFITTESMFPISATHESQESEAVDLAKSTARSARALEALAKIRKNSRARSGYPS